MVCLLVGCAAAISAVCALASFCTQPASSGLPAERSACEFPAVFISPHIVCVDRASTLAAVRRLKSAPAHDAYDSSRRVQRLGDADHRGGGGDVRPHPHAAKCSARKFLCASSHRFTASVFSVCEITSKLSTCVRSRSHSPNALGCKTQLHYGPRRSGCDTLAPTTCAFPSN